jgi:hypothetical protein
MLGESLNNKFYVAYDDALGQALYRALYDTFDPEFNRTLRRALEAALPPANDAPAVVQLQQDLKNVR